jgi:3-deoxy-D-manno-octulosonic-acid transferase
MWDMIGAALFGGGAGIFGSVVSKVLSIWQYKEELKAKKMDYEHEQSLLDRQLSARRDELESEQAIVNITADESVRVASYKHASSVGETSVWVNNILRLVRPVLTLLMVCLTAYVAATFDTITQKELAAQIIAITSMCFAWWFGDRSKTINKP